MSLDCLALIGCLTSLTGHARTAALRRQHSHLAAREESGPLAMPLLDEEAGSGASTRRWQLMYGCLSYVWPDTLPLQVRLCACFLLIVVGRAVNLAVPILYKHVVDVLSAVSTGTSQAPAFWSVFWPWVFWYLVLYFLQGGSGGGGLLNNIRTLLWIPLTQRAYKRVSVDVFRHLLDLDHHFHLRRKTGMGGESDVARQGCM